MEWGQYMKFKYKNRLKRVTDALEKLGVAGMAVGLFRNEYSGFFGAVCLLIISVILTVEDKDE